MKQLINRFFFVLLACLLTVQGLWAEQRVYNFTGVITETDGSVSGFVADNGNWTLTRNITASATGGVNFTLSANGNFVMLTDDEGFYDIKKVTINAKVEASNGSTSSVTFGAGNSSGTVTSTDFTDIVLTPTDYSIDGKKLAISVIGQGTVYLKSITVEWTTPGSISYDVATVEKTFGDANFTNALNKTGDGSVSYATGNDKIATVDAATGEVTIVGAGETTITATVADGADYTYATKTASYTLKVAEATMKVTSADYSGVYDGQAHGITVTAPSGATVKYGTTAGTYDLDTNPTYTDVGTYTVYYQVTQANYITVTGSKTVTITPAAGSISYATATVEKTFGDSKFTNVLTKTGDGSVSYSTGNDKVATVDAATGEVTIVGTGETTITATVADGTDYTYATKTASYTLKVAEATMTVTSADYSGVYDGAAHGITVTAPSGATVKYGTTAGTYDLDASPTYTNVGTYTVYYQVTLANYTAVTGSETITITEATMTVTSAGYNGAYDGQAHGITVTAPSGATVKYGTTAGTYDLDASPTYTDPGTYTVYYQVTIANYSPVTGSETIVIEQATGSISYAENNIVKTIGDAAFTNALTITGDGTVSYSSSDTDVATIDAKTGEVTIVGIGETTITATVTDGTNYTYTTKTASYTLTVNVMDPIVNDNTEAEMTYETTFSDNSEVQTTALTNVVIDNILYTLDDLQTSGTDDDGYDSNTGMLVLNSVVTEENIDQVKSMRPGTEEYAEYFKGLTLIVPQGYGEIEISSFQEEGHALGVKIGDNAPVILSHEEVQTDIIPYAVSQATYVYIYHMLISSSDQVSEARRRGPKTHVSTGLNGMKVHANLIEEPSTEVYHQTILTKAYLAEIERKQDGGIVIDDHYISELNDDVFVDMMKDGGSTIPYIDLRKTSITGLKVDRYKGAFRNVPVSTLIYMPLGNTSDASNVVIGGVCDNLQLSEDSQASYCQLSDFKANCATYLFYLKAGECMTVCLPFAIENPENYGVFYELGDMENGTVSMQVAEQLKPNTPYLFRAGQKDVYLFSADNVTVKKDDGQAASSAFKGNYEKTKADASGRYYGLTINNDASSRRASGVDYTFTQLKAGDPILPFSAYLIVDNGPETFGIQWSDGGATAISNLTQDHVTEGLSPCEGWYTLSGQKLEGKPTQKGLYIHEGKIIVVK